MDEKKLSLKGILKATRSEDWKEAVVTLGYADQIGGLEDHKFDFTVRLGTPEQIYRIISQVGQYNEFDGEKLGAVLSDLVARGILMYVEFGRAGSPVVFVYVKNPEAMKPVVHELLMKFSPDELDEWGPYGLRAWWD